MAFASCNNFNGSVSLDRTTEPYSVVCSGYNFVNKGLNAQEITPATVACVENIWDELGASWNEEPLIWNAPGCAIRDFMEERTPFIRGEICEKHPLADIRFERVECLNRFGGALLREVGNPSNIREDYDETCIGYKTSGTNGAQLTSRWETVSEGFFRGPHVVNKVSIPGGLCVGTEPDYQYTKPAKASDCSGFFPCYELLTVSCIFDGQPSTPPDPACDVGNVLPPSLFQDTLFCSTNPLLLGQRRNIFCSTDVNGLRLRVENVEYCNAIIDNLRFEADKVSFCNAEIDNLRINIGKAEFCSTDDSFLRPVIVIQEARFCEFNRDLLLPVIQSVSFCSTEKPIATVQFCSLDSRGIRNLTFAEFCEADVDNIRFQVDKVEYCEHDQISTVLFSNHRRPTIDGVDDLGFCSYERSTIDGSQTVEFCSINEAGLRTETAEKAEYCSQYVIPNLLFSSQERKTLDGVPEVSFCNYNRLEIDGAVNVAFCNYDRSEIDGAVKVSFCNYDRLQIDGAGVAAFCSQERKVLDNIADVEYCSIDRLQLLGIEKTTFCNTKRSKLDPATEVGFCSINSEDI